jgi:hypothetical protein
MWKNSKNKVGIYLRVSQQADIPLDVQKAECLQIAFKLFDEDVGIEYYVGQTCLNSTKKNTQQIAKIKKESV